VHDGLHQGSILLGRDFLQGVGIQLNFASSTMTWLDFNLQCILMVTGMIPNIFCDELSLDPSTIKVPGSNGTHPHFAIADAKYEKVDIPSVMAEICSNSGYLDNKKTIAAMIIDL
jgi:hypothetical protein